MSILMCAEREVHLREFQILEEAVRVICVVTSYPDPNGDRDAYRVTKLPEEDRAD